MNVDELVDRAEIHDVLVRYSRGLDRVDMALVRDAFHDDAWIDFPDEVYVGPVKGFCEFLSKEMPSFVRTRHNLGNSLVELDGDVAFVETYLTADHEATSYHVVGPLRRPVREACGCLEDREASTAHRLDAPRRQPDRLVQTAASPAW
jgi:SnoaL-like domain